MFGPIYELLIKHLHHCKTTLINLNVFDFFLSLSIFSHNKQNLPQHKTIFINLEN